MKDKIIKLTESEYEHLASQREINEQIAYSLQKIWKAVQDGIYNPREIVGDAALCMAHSLEKVELGPLHKNKILGKNRKQSFDGDLMELHSWVNAVQKGCFIDNDGFGFYSDGVKEFSLMMVHPSDVNKGNILSCFSHIVWYNR